MKSEIIGFATSAHGQNGVSVPHEEALAELQRVLDSPDFDTSPRNRAFLKFVVESTLQGRRIKGYDVAVEAFGRPATFCATTDPIVRIECGKLRKALEVYYLKSGHRNPLRLSIPKGSYRAVFTPAAEYAGTDGPTSGGPNPEFALIVRAAIAGWAEDRHDHSSVWSELARRYPGFPSYPRMTDILESVHLQDQALRDLLAEGLGRLRDRLHATPRLVARLS